MSHSEKSLEFIEKLKAKGRYNKNYDYSQIDYVNSKTKLIVIDNNYKTTHLITPDSLMNGVKCSIKNAVDKSDYIIQRFIEVHGDKYNYSEVNYKKEQVKVKIICSIHGSFSQIAKSHISGSGCPRCKGKGLSLEEVINQLEEVHNGKYDYSKLEFKSQRDKGIIICSEHGEFEQSISKHKAGDGCPKCSGFNKTTDEFIIESRRKFGDKFDYSRARYVNATKMIEFRCIEHDYTFFQTSNNHLNSDYPCEYCEREYKKSLYSMGLNEFKQRMIAAHGDVFSFENTRYVNQKTKIKIQCRKCNSPISSYPQTLINGVGCGTCYELKKRQEYSAEKLKEINKYVKKLGGKCLSNNYENNMTNLQFECKKGHVFMESWADVKYSMRWCKECAPNRLIGETLTRMILEHLLGYQMPSSYIKSMQGLQLDGYNSKHNVAFEYQGYQHYTKGSFFHTSKKDFKAQQTRDTTKKLLCKENGITLIEIFEFKNIRNNRIPLFYEQVVEQLKYLGINYNKSPYVPDLVKLYQGRESNLYKRAKEKVESSGGSIQTYIGSESIHFFTCINGHKVKKRLSVIARNGANCPTCNSIEKYNLMKSIIEKRGGTLIDKSLKSRGYSNKYSWICDKGHKRESKGAYLVQGHWCVECQRENQIIRLDKTELNQFKKDVTSGKMHAQGIRKKYDLGLGVYYKILKRHKLKPKYLPQDRQNQKKRTKGAILQLDPETLKILKKYAFLEDVKRDKDNKFRPENIRFQMKKGRPAYGYYWCRESEYTELLKVFKDKNE
jgi:Zn ribbon nucleic-acid-binding protein